MRSPLVPATWILVMTGCIACALIGKRVGSEAAAGALTETREQILALPPEERGKVAEQAARGAMRGLLDELSTPERRQQISEAISLGVSQALESLARPEALHDGADTSRRGSPGEA